MHGRAVLAGPRPRCHLTPLRRPAARLSRLTIACVPGLRGSVHYVRHPAHVHNKPLIPTPILAHHKLGSQDRGDEAD